MHQLNQDLAKRISNIQLTLVPQLPNENCIQTVIKGKHTILVQISSFYVEFYVSFLKRIYQFIERLKLLIGRMKEIYFSEQLISGFKVKFIELFDYHLLLCENLHLKGKSLLDGIMQTLYTKENAQILRELK